MTELNLAQNFEYHAPPNAAVIEAHTTIRRVCLEAAQTIGATLPPCRERSLAFRKLEEAMFWGNAGIARNHGAFSTETPPTPA